MSAPTPLADLLARADAERAAGRGEDAARLYDEAVAEARGAGDLAAWTRAALGAASVHLFGTDPGKVPAQLHDLLARTTRDADRVRLAAALARCWAYSGRPARAERFAREALDRAEPTGDPALVADSLDAMLACHWGPDDADVRTALGARLDEVAAHVLEPEARLQAHLWGLQVACESLNLSAMHRHLRALDRLGEESPRARFFAASRRLMYDLLRGRTDTSGALLAAAQEAEGRARLADGWMVLKAMRAYAALHAGDRRTCAAIAAEAEAFALAEGVAEVCAEAAWMWVGAGRLDRVGPLVETLGGRALEELPRDVNWLLALQCVLEAALATGHRDVVEQAAGLLAPYAGRPVFNAGAVMFHGLTDDTLARAAALTGDLGEAERLRQRALATYVRIGADWWHDRLRAWRPAPPARDGRDGRAGPARARLHPTGDGVWLVGAEPGTPVRPVRGFAHLQALLARPGVRMPAIDLVTGGSGTVLQSAPGVQVDRQALAAYRRRLADLDAELDEAQDWADVGRAEALEDEREALLAEVARAAGRGGRPRTSGATHERARVAATKAIATALDRIERVDEALGRHLRETVHTGTECAYEPDPSNPVDWVLSADG
ncbi:hypothetical protein [Nocardioides sp. KR10-350]|uniref:hypothetical protein n=1 Tax=Nocardioides cheoyonin TaxID=3156615 RepID=UPI0032B5F0FD